MMTLPQHGMAVMVAIVLFACAVVPSSAKFGDKEGWMHQNPFIGNLAVEWPS